ncbi:hypothetical protein HF265_27600 [Rhizobium leguminosarum]|uniref:hypothetical protein n=1 Tax=Rhizobium leguminosarum TaxID=384 RepID=UPI0012FAAEEB|nr:hypothetical protein [Rhizobium leguminosarum]MBY3032804.1 hypothetical protein [Rhizobium leguminosarum]
MQGLFVLPEESNIAGAKTSSSLAMVAPRPADHNLKAAGSNPAPATNPFLRYSQAPAMQGLFVLPEESNIAGAKTSSSLAMVAPRPADHNLKAAGSNPAPATKQIAAFRAAFCLVTGRGFNA